MNHTFLKTDYCFGILNGWNSLIFLQIKQICKFDIWQILMDIFHTVFNCMTWTVYLSLLIIYFEFAHCYTNFLGTFWQIKQICNYHFKDPVDTSLCKAFIANITSMWLLLFMDIFNMYDVPLLFYLKKVIDILGTFVLLQMILKWDFRAFTVLKYVFPVFTFIWMFSCKFMDTYISSSI